MYELSLCVSASPNCDTHSSGGKDYGDSSQGLQQMERNNSVLHM